MDTIRYLLVILFLFTGSLTGLQAQTNQFETQRIEYSYDAAGNRTARRVIVSNRNIYFADTIQAAEYQEELKMSAGDVKIGIFPNPVKDVLYFEVSEAENFELVSYEIIDMSGRVIEKRGFGPYGTSINFHGYRPGTYILRLFISDTCKEYTVIKE